MVSVIVPLAPQEEFLIRCQQELLKLPAEFELLLVSSEDGPAAGDERLRYVRAAKRGRAAALNCGAEAATHDWLWFVHADTRLAPGTVSALQAAIQVNPLALLYFGIDFYDGTAKHRINALGAKLRSKLFGAPFGDQAFCVPKALHQQIGGYREDAAYGEDHLYARAIKHAQVPQVMVQATVGTSARKYFEHGWLSLMLKYQWMWIAQAIQDQPNLSRS